MKKSILLIGLLFLTACGGGSDLPATDEVEPNLFLVGEEHDNCIYEDRIDRDSNANGGESGIMEILAEYREAFELDYGRLPTKEEMEAWLESVCLGFKN